MDSVEGFLQKIGSRTLSWCTLMEEWSDLVDSCESGYGMSEYDFDFDAQSRDYIERLLTESHVPEEQLSPIRAAVQDIDARLRVLLQQGVERKTRSSYWWRRGVLARAGSEYVDSLRAKGIQVGLIE
jgi:hypothetical protein